MRAIVQRVDHARVEVGDEVVGAIGRGLLAYIGVTDSDTSQQTDWLARKLVGMRVFRDSSGRMNRSVVDVGGEILLVSQFTLYADPTRGMRPGFDRAAPSGVAEPLFDHLVEIVSRSVKTSCGRFGADMKVSSLNDGPVTMIIDRS